MRSLTLVSVLLVSALLAGCGDDSPRTDPTLPAQWGDCTVDDFDQADGQDLGRLGSDVVKLVPAGEGPCAGGLVARTGAGVEGVDVSGLDLEAGTAAVVTLGGGRELLLVHGGVHPRGGFQPHLFGTTGGLQEVLVDGNPLLPFVATDGGGAPTTATCGADDKVSLLAATTSEPPGVVLAWDVQRTTYRIEGSEAVLVGTRQVREHAADPVLREAMPELFDPAALFADCKG